MDKAPRITQVSRTRQSRRCFRGAGRFPHGQAACRQSLVAFPSQKEWGSGSPAPVPSAPGSPRCPRPAPEASGDASRLNCPAPRLIVAPRSKYTRASSPGGGSSLARLVSRAPRPHREDWPLSPLCPPADGGAKRWALRVILIGGVGKLLPAPHPGGAPRRELTLADSRHRLPRTKTIANPANTKRSNAE